MRDVRAPRRAVNADRTERAIPGCAAASRARSSALALRRMRKQGARGRGGPSQRFTCASNRSMMWTTSRWCTSLIETRTSSNGGYRARLARHRGGQTLCRRATVARPVRRVGRRLPDAGQQDGGGRCRHWLKSTPRPGANRATGQGARIGAHESGTGVPAARVLVAPKGRYAEAIRIPALARRRDEFVQCSRDGPSFGSSR